MSDSQDLQPTEALTRRSLRDGGKALAVQSPMDATDPGTTEPPKSGGIAALIRKHPTAWLASALGVAFLLLGTGAVFAGVAAGSSSTAAPIPTESAIPPRPQPSAIPAATHLRTCSAAAAAADPRLMSFAGYVVNATTGEVLFDRNGATPQRTGSVLKVLTAAAALAVLGPNGQLSTKVIEGSRPGSIVLVGGGDPTLATTTSTVYGGAPLISDLANAAVAAYAAKYPEVPITEIVLDSTLWNPADKWDSSWLRKEQSDGYQAEVTALMVDGGRANASQNVSSRSGDPITDAGNAFARAAGLYDVTFTTGSAVGSTVLAEVKSQPVSTLIGQMLISSDNILAEMLARMVSVAMGFDGSSGSLAQAIPGALDDYGLNVSGVGIRDGSGLSDLNAVSPLFVTQLMMKVFAGEANLGLIYSNLPVSGQSGTLASRFNGDNAVAEGAVVAKTGWLDTEYSLAGIVASADGTPLSFAFYAIGDGIQDNAKEALDTLATRLYSCGNNLSNN